MKPWLTFLGKRRPGSVADHAQFSESVSRPAAPPVAHDNGPNVGGHQLGKPNRAARREGRHRA